MIRRRLAEFFNMAAFDAEGNDLIAQIPAEEIEEALLIIGVESEIAEQKNPDSSKKGPLVDPENEDLYAREDDEEGAG